MTIVNTASTLSTSTARQASGRREGWVLILGSSLTIMGAVMIAPVLPKLGAEFGPVSAHADLLVPLVVTGPALAIALCAPLAGWLADRIGRKTLLIIATLLYALLGVAPVVLGDLQALVIVRLLFGAAEAAVMTCCSALIADYWQGRERLHYINRQVVTIGVVGALFFFLGGVMGEHSWRLPFFLYLLPLLLVPAMLTVLWEPIRSRGDAPMDNEANAERQGPERVAVLPLVLGYLLIFGGMVLTFVAPVQVPVLLVELGVTSSSLIGLAAGLNLLATLGGSLAWPLLRRTLKGAGTNAVLLALFALGLWLLTHAHSYNDVLLALVSHGLGAGLLVPNVMAPVMEALTPRTRGRGLGGLTACLYMGQFVSPLVVAALVAYTSDLRHAIDGLALASLIAAALWGIAGVSRRRSAL